MKLRRDRPSTFEADHPRHRPDYAHAGTVGLYDSSLWTGRGAWGGWRLDPPLSWVLWRRWTWALRSWVSARKFRCQVCGVQCDSAPADSGFWRSTAICPAHCPEHDYEHSRDPQGCWCVTCGAPSPDGWR